MVLEPGQTYRDLKYGTDVVVERFNDLVVLATDEKSGHNNLYRREDFAEEERFVKND